jgi:hypothetical protein
MRHALIAVSVLVAGLALPAVASAHRSATRAEKAAMIYRASGRYYHGLTVAEPRSVPLRCFVADISTVVKGSRWGGWTFSRYADDHPRQCRTANGSTVEHEISGRWYVYWEGSDGYPPRHPAHGLRGVPRPIAKDLFAGLSVFRSPALQA